MQWRVLAIVATASCFFSIALGAGTTISIAVSFCPAPSVSLPSSTGTSSATGTSSPPFLLYVSPLVMRKRQTAPTSLLLGIPLDRQYVGTDAELTTNIAQALTFTITAAGQLLTENKLFSTSGLVNSEPFEPLPNTAAISTIFSNSGGDLIWTSNAFARQQAIFCAFGSLLETVFNGELPPGCLAVTLGILPISDVSMPTMSSSNSTAAHSLTTQTFTHTTIPTPTPTPYTPGSVRTNSGTGIPVGCFTSSNSNNSVIAGISTYATTLETCLDFCLAAPPAFLGYFGVSAGNCECSNDISEVAIPAAFGSCDVPCPGDSTENCGGASLAAVAVYSVNKNGAASSTTSATSSSTSNESSKSSTRVSSIVPTTSSASRNSDSSSATLIPVTVSTSSTSLYPSPTTTGTPKCFDRSPFDGTVNNGYLILCDTDLPGFDIEAVDATSLIDCINRCTDYYMFGSSQECVAVQYDTTSINSECTLKSKVGPIFRGGNADSQAAIVVNEPYAPTISYTDQEIATSSTTDIFSSITTSSPPATTSPPLPISVPAPSTTSNQAPPMTSSGMHGVPLTFTQQSTSMTAPVNPPGTTSGQGPPTSSSNLPPTPPSSSLPPGMLTTALQSTPAVPSSTTPAGMTTPTAPTTTSAKPPATTSVVSSAAPSTTTAKPISSAASGPVCLVTPPVGTALCPTYNHQSINVGGFCYEAECSTALQGTIVPQSNAATSLQSCLNMCNLYNGALPFQCLGVNYISANSNCTFLSSITGTIYTLGTDCGRLEYAGYPSPTDALLTASSGAQAPASSSTTTGTKSAANQPSTTTTKAMTTTPPPATSMIATTTTTSAYVGTSCQPAPLMATLCPGTVGTCYTYNTYGTSENYEMECGTQLIGARLQPYAVFSLQDCVGFCQYDNVNRAATCVGVTYLEGPIQNPPINNCQPYSSITGVDRGNSSFDSGRLLYSGYPSITDYPSSTAGP